MTTHTTVPNGYVGLLHEDGVLRDTLEPGRYELRRHFFDRAERRVELVDVRERSLVIKGQEILTRDKVAIRVSLLVYFRVVDARSAVERVADYEARIYEDVQLAARRFLASRELDAILTDRNEISDAVRETVQDRAKSYGVEVIRADVKDLVFPGNLRAIMNQVLETERRAEARLIQARKDIEAEELHSRANHESERLRLEAERERMHLELQAQAERQRADLERRKQELQAKLEEAEAMAAQPILLRLRELETLWGMARSGGKFVVGLDGLGEHGARLLRDVE